MKNNPIIAVVLPVVQCDMAKALLLQMNSNTVTPGKMVIMDDSDHGFDPPSGLKFPMIKIRTKERGMVNESFNIGVKAVGSADFVMISNDDIVIHDRIFEKTIIAFQNNPKFGTVCHKQVGSISEVGYDREERYTVSRDKQGAAIILTFRKGVLDRIPPIPSLMRVFYGDDYWWNHIIRMGYFWGKIESSRFYHYESVSVKQRGMFGMIGYDKKGFQRVERRILKVPEEAKTE